MTPQHLLAAAARSAAAAVEVAVHAYDACPLATHARAERARDAHWLRADKAAMADPEYAAIQARSTEGSSGPGPLLNTSDGHNISQTDFETQLRISSHLTPTRPGGRWPRSWPTVPFGVSPGARRPTSVPPVAGQTATTGT